MQCSHCQKSHFNCIQLFYFKQKLSLTCSPGSWFTLLHCFSSLFAHIYWTSFTTPNTNRMQKTWSFMKACILKRPVFSKSSVFWHAEGLRIKNHQTISFIQQIKSFSHVSSMKAALLCPSEPHPSFIRQIITTLKFICHF